LRFQKAGRQSQHTRGQRGGAQEIKARHETLIVSDAFQPRDLIDGFDRDAGLRPSAMPPRGQPIQRGGHHDHSGQNEEDVSHSATEIEPSPCDRDMRIREDLIQPRIGNSVESCRSRARPDCNQRSGNGNVTWHEPRGCRGNAIFSIIACAITINLMRRPVTSCKIRCGKDCVRARKIGHGSISLETDTLPCGCDTKALALMPFGNSMGLKCSDNAELDGRADRLVSSQAWPAGDGLADGPWATARSFALGDALAHQLVDALGHLLFLRFAQ